MHERPRWSVEIAAKGQVEDYCEELLNKLSLGMCPEETKCRTGSRNNI